MKKVFLLAIVALMVFSGMSFAASSSSSVKWSMGAAFNTAVQTGQPICNANINDKYDVFFGYSSVTNGSGNDATTDLLLGGVMYLNKIGNIMTGPSLTYFSDGRNVGAGKASDDTLTSFSVGYSAKTALVTGVELRADAILFSSTSGKIAGADVSGTSLAPVLQIAMLFQFL